MLLSKSLVLAAFALAIPATAQESAANACSDDWVEDAKAYIEAEQDLEEVQNASFNESDGAYLEFVQSRGRMWTCFARSRAGRVYSGSSTNANSARRIAMNRCISRSNGCTLRSCR